MQRGSSCIASILKILFLAGSVPEGLSPVHPEDSGCCITNQISSDKMDPAVLKNIYI